MRPSVPMYWWAFFVFTI